ncbi:hypothetical protein PMI01_02829 [Caulobacter sp. AP07]|uniref:hypothetical protein n=1 Tax=Caulobacter sp. AP07 TaxID=1144304 RepID=UPI000272252F|nr:hypothetical protein [Caulobacter sp. AP07]EJL31295.1 hypothetical protein PMI01_02829 [Caulobacter sp. AP07]
MPDFQLALAPKQLTQTINPWSWTMGNVSLFSINLGTSKAPGVESRVLNEVGTYGRQLGRIGEALATVIAWAESQGMPGNKAIEELKLQLEHIDVIRREEGLSAALPAATAAVMKG